MAKVQYKNGVTSVILRVAIQDTASTVGAGKTGLTNASSGLVISTIADTEATATAYTAAGSTIDGITTLGTFAAPASGHCRFKEVDATNHPGIYEIQIADARWAVSNARSIIISTQVTGGVLVHAELQLSAVDPNDGVRGGMTALPNAAAAQSGGLPTVDANNAVKLQTGTGANQISLASGLVTLAAAGLDGITIETGINARQALSPILAACAGVLSGAGTGTVVVKNPAGATTRITATTDASGNRSAITLNLPA